MREANIVRWNGPRSLRDMMNFGADENGMSVYFADYPFRLYCLNEIDNFGMFRTQLRKVFEVLRYRTDKEEMFRIIREGNGYRNLDEETLEMLAVLMNEPRIWEQRKEYEQKKNVIVSSDL